MKLNAILILVFTSFLAGSIYCQDRVDRILMTNGEIKEGSVTGISDTDVDFVHSGETLTYHLKKASISKIEFSSGRIEVFNPVAPVTEGVNNLNLADHHNKIAVLPFVYIKDGSQQKGDAMEVKAQREFFALMNGHVGQMKVQDPNTTNSLLKKNGLNSDNYSGYTMPEIANMLGVEYIV